MKKRLIYFFLLLTIGIPNTAICGGGASIAIATEKLYSKLAVKFAGKGPGAIAGVLTSVPQPHSIFDYPHQILPPLPESVAAIGRDRSLYDEAIHLSLSEKLSEKRFLDRLKLSINIQESLNNITQESLNATHELFPEIPAVTIIQEFINTTHELFPEIPAVAIDGIYGHETATSIKAFQQKFGPKLFKIPLIYGTNYNIQKSLNAIHELFPEIPAVTINGIYSPETATSVKAFQQKFGLEPDGVAGSVRSFQQKFGLEPDGVAGSVTLEKIVTLGKMSCVVVLVKHLEAFLISQNGVADSIK